MLTKEKKKEIIDGLADKLCRQKAVVFFDYTGLKVNDSQKLRDKLREKGIDCQVSRKTLIDLALEKAGFKEVKVKEMSGQPALAFGYEDEILPAKIVYDFSRENGQVKILSGLVNGEYLGNEAIVSLAQLPSKQELLAKLVGGISSPLSGLNNVLSGNLRKLIYILKNCKI
jgi:large subunit ribosomal protein L10